MTMIHNSETNSPFKRLFNFIKMNAELRQALLCIMFIGAIFLIVSEKLKESNLPFVALHEIGVLCLTVTPILFIYELALRRLFISEMSNEMDKVISISNDTLKEELFYTIKKSMPSSYDNILRFGISDAYDSLDPVYLKKRLETSVNTNIKLIKIYIPYLHEALEPEILIQAIIERGCSFSIVLCDPDCLEAIEKRTRSVGYDPIDYILQIKSSIRYLQNVWRELYKRDEKLAQKLCVRAHDDFIAGSLAGFHDYYIFGVYLHKRVATRGMQFKIERGVRSEIPAFYKELDEHFKMQWDMAYKDVVFDIEKEYVFKSRNCPVIN